MTKQFFIVSTAAMIAAAVAGCSERAGQNTENAAETSAGATMPKAAQVAPRMASKETFGGKAVQVEEETKLYIFTYSYPAEAAAIPDLKLFLDADLKSSRATLAADAKEAEAEAKGQAFSFNPYSLGKQWKSVADTPRFLSLSSEISSYSGGAHGNMGFASLLWDKKTNRRLDVLDVFTSQRAFTAAITKRFCEALDRERAKRRGSDYSKSGISEFDECIDPAASTIILGSSDKKRFDKIGILIAPYDAGPYAEGSYEVTLPVTQILLKAIKPEYQDAFAAK